MAGNCSFNPWTNCLVVGKDKWHHGLWEQSSSNKHLKYSLMVHLIEQLQISKAAFLPDFLAYTQPFCLSSISPSEQWEQFPSFSRCLSQAPHFLWLLRMPWRCSFAPMGLCCHPYNVPVPQPLLHLQVLMASSVTWSQWSVPGPGTRMWQFWLQGTAQTKVHSLLWYWPQATVSLLMFCASAGWPCTGTEHLPFSAQALKSV